eukprot:403332083
MEQASLQTDGQGCLVQIQNQGVKSNIPLTQQINLSSQNKQKSTQNSAPRSNNISTQMQQNNQNNLMKSKTTNYNQSKNNIGQLTVNGQIDLINTDGSGGSYSNQINLNQSGKLKDQFSYSNSNAIKNANSTLTIAQSPNVATAGNGTGMNSNIYEKQSSLPKHNQNQESLEQEIMNSLAPSITNLTGAQSKKVSSSYNAKYNPKLRKNQVQDQKLQNTKANQRSGLGLISSTGGNSFQKFNQNLYQNQNQHNQAQSKNMSNLGNSHQIHTSGNSFQSNNNQTFNQQHRQINQNSQSQQQNQQIEMIQSSNNSDVVNNFNLQHDRDIQLRKSPTTSLLMMPTQQCIEQQSLNRVPSRGTLGNTLSQMQGIGGIANQKKRNQVQSHRPASGRPHNISNLANRTLNPNTQNQLQTGNINGNLVNQQQQLNYTPLSAEKKKINQLHLNRYNSKKNINAASANPKVIQSLEQISNLQQSNNVSMNSSHKSGTGSRYITGGKNGLSSQGKIMQNHQRGVFGTGSNYGQSQKVKMLKIISQQQNSVNFSKTLRSYQCLSGSSQTQDFNNNLGSGMSDNNLQNLDEEDFNEKDCMLSEEDIYQKEEQLSVIHKELKNKSIEMLTDQLMLKDKEINTLKKQLEIMRNQLIAQQPNSSQQSLQENLGNSKQKNFQSIEEEEERKSFDRNQQHNDLSSFDDSSLQVIKQTENPYHPNLKQNQGQKQSRLQRSDGRQLGSHQNLPVKGLVRSGSSQLNNKLGKMKSTADLFSGLRNQVNEGESVQDYLNRYQPKQAQNLEDVIKESMIEASQSQSVIQHQLNDGADSEAILNCKQGMKNQMLFEKSMSLLEQQYENEEDLQSNRIIDDLFSNRHTNFDPQELERLVDFSHDEDRQSNLQNNQLAKNHQSEQKNQFSEREKFIPTGMNDQSSIIKQNYVRYEDNNDNEPKQLKRNNNFHENLEFMPDMNLQSHNSSDNFMLFEGNDRLLYEQKLFDDSPSQNNNNLGESQQVIMRNDDSFTSKQTNDYLKDLYAMHEVGLEHQPAFEKEISENQNSQNQKGFNSNKKTVTNNQNQFWDDSPAHSQKSESSNDTARLSYSKEEKIDQNNNPISTQLSNDKKHYASPMNNFILQTQSIQSIGDLLKEAKSPTLRNQNPLTFIAQISQSPTQNSHINKINALNLQTKKSIEFSSPPSSNITRAIKQNTQSLNPQIINPQNLSVPQSLQSSAINNTNFYAQNDSSVHNQRSNNQASTKMQIKLTLINQQTNLNPPQQQTSILNTAAQPMQNSTGVNIGMNRQKSTGKLMTMGVNQQAQLGSTGGIIIEKCRECCLDIPTTRNFAVWFSHIGKQQSITDARCANGLLHSKKSLCMIGDILQPGK